MATGAPELRESTQVDYDALACVTSAKLCADGEHRGTG